MNSSKTANMLMVAHNYRSKDKKILLIKPSCDTRGSNPLMISSRAGQSMHADLLLEGNVTDISFMLLEIECILVDEAQFLTTENIDMLRGIAMSIPVLCYGLRTDYTSKLFPGSKRLMEIADNIEQICTICVGCSRKATVNAKFIPIEHGTRVITKDGSPILDLGAEEKYQPMCWQCWREG